MNFKILKLFQFIYLLYFCNVIISFELSYQLLSKNWKSLWSYSKSIGFSGIFYLAFSKSIQKSFIFHNSCIHLVFSSVFRLSQHNFLMILAKIGLFVDGLFSNDWSINLSLQMCIICQINYLLIKLEHITHP